MAEESILVVDDDPIALEAVCEMLESEGLPWVRLRSDLEAYKALDGSAPPAGIVLDINLGVGTTGFDVARHARQIFPQLPVVYISGQIRTEAFHAFGVPGSRFLQKPFTARDLVAALEADSADRLDP